MEGATVKYSTILYILLQPGVHLIDFALDKIRIVKGACQYCNALTAGQKVHCKCIGIFMAAKVHMLN